MKTITEVALSELASPYFFTNLGGMFARMKLKQEQKYAIALYVATLSRFLPCPLRVHIAEETKGGVTFFVQKVAKLLPKTHRVGISRDLDEAWPNFAEYPNHKVVYVRPANEGPPKTKFRTVISGNEAKGIFLLEQGGRVVERPTAVQGRFTYISAEAPEFPWTLTRWLTIRLPNAQENGASNVYPPTDKDLDIWRKIQELIGDRAKIPVVLPEWEELVLEQILRDDRADRAARHLPAFLTLWKITSLIRSFSTGTGSKQGEFVRADFKSLASACALRQAFREGHWFPSPSAIYQQIAKPGDETALLSPLTGKPLRYRKEQKARPPVSLLSRGA
jgi:hypothetical protein